MRIATVIPAVLVVQEEEEEEKEKEKEEKEADEFRPEPAPEDRECQGVQGTVGQKTTRCGGVIPRWC